MGRKKKVEDRLSTKEQAKISGESPKVLLEWGVGYSTPYWRIVSKYYPMDNTYAHVLEIQIPDALGIKSWREVSFESCKALADALMALANDIAKGYITATRSNQGNKQLHPKPTKKQI